MSDTLLDKREHICLFILWATLPYTLAWSCGSSHQCFRSLHLYPQLGDPPCGRREARDLRRA